MKRALVVLGVAALIAGGALAGYLFRTHRSGKALCREFFEAVLSGEPVKLYAKLNSDLRKKLHQSIVEAWMEALKTNLASYKGTEDAQRFALEGGATRIEGTARFAEGEAQVALVLDKGEISDFAVTAPEMRGWGPGPASYHLLREEGARLLRQLLDGNIEEAREMMHSELRGRMPPSELGAAMKATVEKAGKLDAVRPVSENLKVKPDPELSFVYSIVCEDATLEGEVIYQYVGARAHLVGFFVKR